MLHLEETRTCNIELLTVKYVALAKTRGSVILVREMNTICCSGERRTVEKYN